VSKVDKAFALNAFARASYGSATRGVDDIAPRQRVLNDSIWGRCAMPKFATSKLHARRMHTLQQYHVTIVYQ
jgi:hypothetical protein